MFDLDYPAMLGVVQNQDSYAQGVAAQRPFYFDHIRDLTDRAMGEYAELSGREYARAMGYRLEDAEYVLAGQGSVVWNAEAVADYLRESRGLKVGVLDVVMFRPFPADLVTAMLRGKKAVAVLERVDQPLAVDPPLLREIRAAMSQGMENARSTNGRPFPGLEAVSPDEIPAFYSGGFGFGSRDLQPGDIIAAVDNMLEGGKDRRQFYLGIDFIREDTHLPKLQIWQHQLREAYPDLKDLALKPTERPNLLPKESISIRMHSVGGWGAITTGKNIVMTAFELLGLDVKANPKYGSEKKGQPTTFYATLSHEPVRLNAELKHVDVVLSPDPNVFRNSDPFEGMAEGGVFVIQSDLDADELWEDWTRTSCGRTSPPRPDGRSASSGSRSMRWTPSRSRRRKPRTPNSATGCRARRSWAPSSRPPHSWSARGSPTRRCSRVSAPSWQRSSGTWGTGSSTTTCA
jgi:pyruvate-ferredoxin/flavodoxin oxidoreductase